MQGDIFRNKNTLALRATKIFKNNSKEYIGGYAELLFIIQS